MALNDVAWSLATGAGGTAVDPVPARRIATLAADTTKHQTPEVLDTLAAAYAATGEFDAASRTMRDALDLVGPAHAYVTEFRERLALYEAEQTYRP